nr:cytochrome p450 93a2 [Quercus suber]
MNSSVPGYVKRMEALIKNFDQFLDHVFDEHKAKKGGVKDFVPKDTVNVLLHLADDPNVDIKLTYDNIKAFIQEIYFRG